MEQKGVQFLIILVSIVFFFMLIFFIALISYLKRKRIQFALEKERDNLRFQEQLLMTEAEITEQNLKNVSWELHDNIGQLLSIASIEMGMLMQHKTIDSNDLVEIKSLVKQSIDEVRSLSKTLNTDVIKSFGLIDMIEVELERLNRMNLMKTEFVHPEVMKVEANNEVIIFRMIQEFINNTLKHAEAGLLKISISEQEDKYFILLEDDGKGFDINSISSSSGLINFEKRANLIGGEFNFESTPGVGTKMTIII